MTIIGKLFDEQNRMIGRAARGLGKAAEIEPEDIESQLIIKRKKKDQVPTGASSGGLLNKDEGFEGFHSVNDRDNATTEE